MRHAEAPGGTDSGSLKLFLTYPQLAERLQISERHLHVLVARGKIPHKKLGRLVRFYWPQIITWLQQDKGAKR